MLEVGHEVGNLLAAVRLEAHLLDELRTAGRGLRTQDGKEARRALREKRKPVFTGR